MEVLLLPDHWILLYFLHVIHVYPTNSILQLAAVKHIEFSVVRQLCDSDVLRQWCSHKLICWAEPCRWRELWTADCHKVCHSLTLLLSWSHTLVLSGLFYMSLATMSHSDSKAIIWSVRVIYLVFACLKTDCEVTGITAGAFFISDCIKVLCK